MSQKSLKEQLKEAFEAGRVFGESHYYEDWVYNGDDEVHTISKYSTEDRVFKVPDYEKWYNLHYVPDNDPDTVGDIPQSGE